MKQQSNSTDLALLSAPELAAVLGQLRLVDCEQHRALIVARLTDAGRDVGPNPPLVALLRLLGDIPTENTPYAGSPSGERGGQQIEVGGAEVAFAR